MAQGTVVSPTTAARRVCLVVRGGSKPGGCGCGGGAPIGGLAGLVGLLAAALRRRRA
jgi:uncharacterized protein (TIGR03382 family)